MADSTHRSTRAPTRSPVIGLIVAAAVFVLVGAAVLLSEASWPRGEDAVHDGEEAPLPTGAGSVADGAADMERGGLTDGTLPDEAVDQTINSDTVPALLQVDPEGQPQPSAAGLEPIDEDSGPILEEIDAETDATLPETDGTDAGDGADDAADGSADEETDG
jgi:hypothetical protein